MLIYRFFAGVAFFSACAWVIAKPGWDSASAAMAALAAFVATFLLPKKRAATQTQTVGAGGIGVQAGGNVSMGNIDNQN